MDRDIGLTYRSQTKLVGKTPRLGHQVESLTYFSTSSPQQCQDIFAFWENAIHAWFVSESTVTAQRTKAKGMAW